jgi:proteasome assembly chaperone (PAC2) family protein
MFNENPSIVRKLKRVALKNPAVIACWPGMGEVAVRAGLYLKEALGFEEFAEVVDSGFFPPQGIVSEKGVVSLPRIDEGTFYYRKDPNKKRDVVLFVAEAQPPMDRAFEFAWLILDFIATLKSSVICTFASLPQPIDYAKDSGVWAVASDEALVEDLKALGVGVMQDGQVSGLNGLLVGAAAERGMRSMCLLAEIPFYTVQIENPKATKAVLKVVEKYLGETFDYAPIDTKAKALESEIEKLISYIKGHGAPDDGDDDDDDDGEEPEPLSEEDIQHIKSELSTFPRLPRSVAKTVETFFEKAKNDITQAHELKKLLDNWGVYKEYEDRFLDLFKKKGFDH